MFYLPFGIDVTSETIAWTKRCNAGKRKKTETDKYEPASATTHSHLRN